MRTALKSAGKKATKASLLPPPKTGWTLPPTLGSVLFGDDVLPAMYTSPDAG
ncbi:MAG: hypothetical protein IPI73_18275 [Betaproteobacteria bacterium]|nr:hypothetical protein [Betaproteobacteria bacterium]